MKRDVNFIASKESFKESMKSYDSLKVRDPVALDIEATGLDCFTDKIILIQIATKDVINLYDARYIPHELLKELMTLLEDMTIIAHNAKYDTKFIYEKFGILFNHIHDTQITESIAKAGLGYGDFPNYKHKWRYSLNDLLKDYCYYEIPKNIRNDFVDNYDIVLTEDHKRYAADDVRYLNEIMDKQIEKIRQRKLFKTYDLEMRLIPVVVDMEHEGIDFDKTKWKKLSEQAWETVEKLREDFYEMINSAVVSSIEEHEFENSLKMCDHLNVTHNKAKYYKKELREETTTKEMLERFWKEFNYDSPYQMKAVLNAAGIPAENTDSRYLEQKFHGVEMVEKLIEYRAWIKKATSFSENFFQYINEKTGRIHSEFNAMGAATGRFSSDSPNLQNIIADAEYRHCFLAGEDHFLMTADYSQVEMRMAAELSQDEIMVDAFNTGKDLHAITGRDVFGVDIDDQDNDLRTKAKSFNFSILYKVSKYGISRNFSIPLGEASELLSKYRGAYPGLASFMKMADKKIWESGFSITPYGRKRFFIIPKKWHESKTMWKYYYKVMREGFNHIIQGGCGDILKLAMIKIWYENPFGDKLKIVLTVHDELAVKIHKDVIHDARHFVHQKMVEAGETFIKSIPVEVDYKVKPYWEK